MDPIKNPLDDIRLHAIGPGDSDDGCDHSDHGEDSDADSPDTDAG